MQKELLQLNNFFFFLKIEVCIWQRSKLPLEMPIPRIRVPPLTIQLPFTAPEMNQELFQVLEFLLPK